MSNKGEAQITSNTLPNFGVGLRHQHYSDALNDKVDSTDFIEIHAENFFAEGGKLIDYLEAVSTRYPMSIHGTAMGLGSASGVPVSYLRPFKQLVERVNPIHISDHASFSWGTINNQPVHSGDLLPLTFDMAHLDILVNNVDHVQQTLGRKLLVENIVSYLDHAYDPMYECDFLSELVSRTQCGLLVDINNIVVNQRNFARTSKDVIPAATRWLSSIVSDAVEEIHLAGSSKPPAGELIVDDHSQPVDEEGWMLYRHATTLFTNASTLIEWDNDLPSWQELNAEAKKARKFHSTLSELKDDEK